MIGIDFKTAERDARKILRSEKSSASEKNLAAAFIDISKAWDSDYKRLDRIARIANGF